MKPTSFAIAAILAGAIGSASADTINIDLEGGPLNWTSHKVGNTHEVGVFSDTFTFTNYAAAASEVSASLVNTATGLSDITFTGVTINGISVPFYNIFAWSAVSFSDVDVTGPLTLVVNGFVSSKAGGTASYGGTFTVTSAVPEPATYGMLAGGLAVLAFAARRRKD